MSVSYRDDVEAARLHRDALARELAEVEQRLHERDGLEARASELRAALADAADLVRQARVRAKLPLLNAVTVATPCDQSWNEMVGDDRKRFCGKCEKHVFDLSQMSAREAETLLGASGETPCLRIHRRPDGTVMTSDCPEGAKRRRRRKRVAIAAALVAGGVGLTAALAGSPPVMMGKMESVVPPPPELPVEVTQGQAVVPQEPREERIMMGKPPPPKELEELKEPARTRAPSGRHGR